jgi:hypothetical protein
VIALIEDDPRLQQGAYITDGVELYEVRGLRRGQGVMGISMVWVMVENCRSQRHLDVLVNTIKRAFELVRLAPVPLCPDLHGGDCLVADAGAAHA